ncbi:MAG TPA: hydroxymethylglutaryl-CoA synthase [Patescibacteria group bacterium]|jgi:hydroxymethylglutaryl-CoA synthase|nr:hydroxymethylglutaryl-CoA synthase [Patescibacteria group bacterium]
MKNKTVGIISYGTYIPLYRVKLSDIAHAWRKNPGEVVGSLGIIEKSVPGVDEDAVTIALEAAVSALHSGNEKPTDIEALFVGSESHPYAVNPTSTIVGELLGVGNHYLAADLEFACKAATAGMQAIAGLATSGHIRAGLAIGADTAQSKPHDALEYTSASAGVAYLIGTDEPVAELLSYTSYSSDTPDFWRRDGIRYPTHAGRFTGEPAYFAHVIGSSNRLFEQAHIKPGDITHCVFHMPNAKFPRDVARRLGFSHEQLASSLTVDLIGNPYSASALLGLAATLDVAKPGDMIFMASYGSGAGSDAFLWQVGKGIVDIQKQRKKRGELVDQQVAHKMNIDYVGYLKNTHKI